MILAACQGESPQKAYSIEGTIADLRADGKAYLYVMLPEYQKLMLLDSAEVRNGAFRFNGSVDEPMEAFVRLKGDTAAYSFVLTNNRLSMTVGDGTYVVQGSRSNLDISLMLADVARRDSRRDSLQKVYKKMAADSTLTKPVEDSLMLAYHKTGADCRRRLLSRLVRVAPVRPLAASVALRMIGGDMLQSEIDSVRRLMPDK